MLQQQIVIFIGFLISFSYLLLQNSGRMIGFLFNSIKIPAENYMFYLGVFIMNFGWALSKYMESGHVVWRVHAIIFFVWILDYVVNYCNPYFWYSFELKAFTRTQPEGWYIPFSWYLIIGLTMIVLIIKTWIWG